MKLVMENGKILKECFNSVGRIIDEATIECDEEGIRLKALDRSHISFVELDLKASLFDEYECGIPEKISIDTFDFNNIMKRYKNNDSLEIETSDSVLILRFNGNSNRTFKLKLISLDYETPVPPSLDLPVNLTIPCDFIKESLKDIDIYSDKVRFVVDEDYLILDGDGEFGEVTDKILHGAIDIIGVVESVFSLDKIDEMLKEIKFADDCSVYLGNDMPLVLEMYLNGGVNLNDGFIKFLLAPRLEADDE